MVAKFFPVATFVAGLAIGSMALPLFAQDHPAASLYKKVELNFSNWTKGRFSEAVVVSHPGRFITIAGMGAELVENGKTLYPGDMLGQCRYALGKIKKALASQGATLADVTRMITFVTDMGGGTRESAKPYHDYITCKKEAFAGMPQPAGTIVQVTRLASPDMLIEINIDAVRPD